MLSYIRIFTWFSYVKVILYLYFLGKVFKPLRFDKNSPTPLEVRMYFDGIF